VEFRRWIEKDGCIVVDTLIRIFRQNTDTNDSTKKAIVRVLTEVRACSPPHYMPGKSLQTIKDRQPRLSTETWRNAKLVTAVL
jgi:hypothetical protein